MPRIDRLALVVFRRLDVLQTDRLALGSPVRVEAGEQDRMRHVPVSQKLAVANQVGGRILVVCPVREGSLPFTPRPSPYQPFNRASRTFLSLMYSSRPVGDSTLM